MTPPKDTSHLGTPSGISINFYYYNEFDIGISTGSENGYVSCHLSMVPPSGTKPLEFHPHVPRCHFWNQTFKRITLSFGVCLMNEICPLESNLGSIDTL